MRRDSPLVIAAQLVALMSAMIAIAAWNASRTRSRPAMVSSAVAVTTPVVPVKAPAKRVVAPAVVPPPRLDEAVIARADAEVESAKNDRVRAERRADEAADRLGSAQTRAASAAKSHKGLASTIRDPSSRLRSSLARGSALKVERDKLVSEVGALNAAPKPRRKPLIDKSPVAKKADGDEFHFEVHGDRVAFIDLERLLDKVKTDARVQIRMINGRKPASGSVGPVGAFTMSYEIARMDDGSNPRIGSFGLTGWEIVPENENRGELFDTAMRPASNFARAINRLNPSSDVVTFWIYPDGFPLYRRLRDALHAQGFSVAARPLPEGTSIKGSPSGSSSSAQ